jgi:hypothetical protein
VPGDVGKSGYWSWAGGVGAAGGGGPAEPAAGLAAFEVPAGCLLVAMMMAADGIVAALADIAAELEKQLIFCCLVTLRRAGGQ